VLPLFLVRYLAGVVRSNWGHRTPEGGTVVQQVVSECLWPSLSFSESHFPSLCFQCRISRSRASFSRRVRPRDGKPTVAFIRMQPQSSKEAKGHPGREAHWTVAQAASKIGGRVREESRGAWLGKQLAAVGAQGRTGRCTARHPPIDFGGPIAGRGSCALCTVLVLLVSLGSGAWCSVSSMSCLVLVGGPTAGLESGKIGMPQADLQPSAPSPLAPSHASASGVPPCEVHAGNMGGYGCDMGGCGWATWVDMGSLTASGPRCMPSQAGPKALFHSAAAPSPAACANQ
jgi:hypothetical protein